MIHIEGMGWLGSALAYNLHRRGIAFTWNDPEAPHVAWKASTGLTYPAGDRRSTSDLAGWGQWLRDEVFPLGTVEQVAYCYAHKHPPHAGQYPTTRLEGLTVADAPCYAANVPAIVHAARQQFAAHRLDTGPTSGVPLVRANPSHRGVAVMWGWSTPVRLDLPPEFAQLPHRPAFYGRRVRRLVYAYPVPGRPRWWWAGSSLIRQSTPRLLNAAKHHRRWEQDWDDTFPGIPVLERGDPVQGWRPRAADEDTATIHASDGVITFPALWHSGVRWAPTVINDTLHALQTTGVM